MDRVFNFSTCSDFDAQRAHEALNTYAFPRRMNKGIYAFKSKRAEVMAVMAATATAAAGSDQNGGRRQCSKARMWSGQWRRPGGAPEPRAAREIVWYILQVCARCIIENLFL